jgi:hypothetical protein
MAAPLAACLSEKFADRFGCNQSLAGRIVVQSPIFVIALLPMPCLILIVLMLLSSGLSALFGAD